MNVRVRVDAVGGNYGETKTKSLMTKSGIKIKDKVTKTRRTKGKLLGFSRCTARSGCM